MLVGALCAAIVLGVIAAYISYRRGKDAGFQQGYTSGLNVGRNQEPVEAVQREIAEITAEGQDVRDRTNKLSLKVNTLAAELERLAPLQVRIRRIQSVERAIAEYKKQIIDLTQQIEDLHRQSYKLQHNAARGGYAARNNISSSIFDRELNILGNEKLERQQQLADVQKQLRDAQTTLVDLTDDLAAKRAELNTID